VTPPGRGLADKIDWSPDGSRFVFSSPEFDRPGHAANVFTVRTDGSAPRQLTHDRGDLADDGADSWSPDGKKIAFVRFRHGVFQIYLMGADGTHLVRVTHSAGGGHGVAWGTHP
jgi:TolB protein